MKVCTKCGLEKDESEFYKNARYLNGLMSECKSCKKERTKSWTDAHEDYAKELRTRNKTHIDSLKTQCVKCGDKRKYILQFHHINPKNKLFELSDYGTHNIESIDREIEKCVLLCSNCHDEFHWFYGKHPKNPEQALTKYLNK